jgi:capsular exopolysaccharide synthesis family protein
VVRQRAIIAVAKHVKVSRAGQSYVAKVAFTSRDPAKAARLANAFALAFVHAQQASKAQAAQDASSLIGAQLNPLKDELEKKEAAVVQYRAKHNMFSAAGKTVNEQQISDLAQQQSLARLNRDQALAKLREAQQQLQAGASGEALGEALLSPVIQKLREQRAVVSAHLADQAGRLGPKHPEIIASRRQLSDIDAQIQAEITRIMTNLQSQVDVASQQTASVERGLNSAQAGLAATNVASVGLNQLERDAETSRIVYEAALAKAKQTAQQQNVSQADAQVTALADTPLAPSAPNKPLAVLLGAILGVAAGVVAVIGHRLLDSTLRTQDDVESKLGVPFLAGIPTADSSIKDAETKDPIEAVLKHPLSGFAEAFRALSTAVTLSRPDGAKIIAITSSLPNEGKTTTSICLSEVLSIGGSRVITLDCDLRRRSVNESLKADVKYGLTDVIDGTKTVDEAVYKDARSGVEYLLLPRAQVATARSPLDLPQFDALLAELAERYDYVILDTPPLLPIVDTRKLAKKVDAVVLLCRWQHTPKRAVLHSIRLLQDVGVAVSGVALTRVDLKAQQRYGYGDSNYYYQSYSDYYLEEQTAD